MPAAQAWCASTTTDTRSGRGTGAAHRLHLIPSWVQPYVTPTSAIRVEAWRCVIDVLMNGANLIRVAGELVRVWQWDVVEQALHSFTHAIVGHSGTTRKRHPRGTHRHTQSRTLAISSRWLGSTSSSLPMSRPRCSASIRSSVAWGRISSIKSPSRWTVSPYAQPAPTPATQHDANVRLLEATWESTQHGGTYSGRQC